MWSSVLDMLEWWSASSLLVLSRNTMKLSVSEMWHLSYTILNDWYQCQQQRFNCMKNTKQIFEQRPFVVWKLINIQVLFLFFRQSISYSARSLTFKLSPILRMCALRWSVCSINFPVGSLATQLINQSMNLSNIESIGESIGQTVSRSKQLTTHIDNAGNRMVSPCW
jgi:hypothetical protein